MGATFVNPMVAYQAAQRQKVSSGFNRPLALQQMFHPKSNVAQPLPRPITPALKPSISLVSTTSQPVVASVAPVTPTATAAVPALVAAATGAGAPSAAGTDLTALDESGTPTSPTVADGASPAAGGLIMLAVAAAALFFVLNRKGRR